MSDLEGKFKLVLPDTLNLDEFVLTTPNIGYETSEILVSRKKLIQPLEILLNTHITTGLSVIEICEVKKTPGYYLRGIWWKTKSLFRKND
jgi:hypothetical protein